MSAFGTKRTILEALIDASFRAAADSVPGNGKEARANRACSDFIKVAGSAVTWPLAARAPNQYARVDSDETSSMPGLI